MYSLLNIPRVQICILNEVLPNWRELVDDGPLWDWAWMRATGSDRTTSWRWRQKALALAESLADAA